MNNIVCTLCLSLMFTGVLHGAEMRLCRDLSGRVTYTQTDCPVDSTKQTLDVPTAQAPIQGLRTGELAVLEQLKRARQDHSDVDEEREELTGLERRNRRMTVDGLYDDLHSNNRFRRKWAKQALIKMGEYVKSKDKGSDD
ncbi:MAG: hypothetical protein GY934_15620 [Gammaproteobacteria bacterium]|nr:hypothetical protein [Gammaproteobacteria bacterium]